MKSNIVDIEFCRYFAEITKKNEERGDLKCGNFGILKEKVNNIKFYDNYFIFISTEKRDI